MEAMLEKQKESLSQKNVELFKAQQAVSTYKNKHEQKEAELNKEV